MSQRGALRQHLEEACGNDPGQYATKKAESLRILGYTGRPFAVKMNFELANSEEFIDVMLGLKTDVPARITEHAETRFDITIRKEDLSNVAGTLTVQPHSAIPCTLMIRRDRISDPIVFIGDFVMAPALGEKKKVGGFLFKNRLISFVGKLSEENFSINLNFIKIEEETSLHPKEWLQMFSAIQALCKSGSSISIEPDGLERLMFNKLDQLMSVAEDVVAFDVENAKRVVRLAEMACAADKIQLSFSELGQQADVISAGYALLSDQKELSDLSFEITNQANMPALPDVIRGLHINYVVCGDDLIVWSANVNLVCEVEGNISKFVSTSIEFEQIVKMKKTQYKTYIEEVRLKAGSGIFMARESIEMEA